MSEAAGIAGVLLRHESLQGFDGDTEGCRCGWWVNSTEWADHVADVVRAWLADVLDGDDVLVEVGEAIALASGEVTISGEPEAALEAVRHALGIEESP